MWIKIKLNIKFIELIFNFIIEIYWYRIEESWKNFITLRWIEYVNECI